MLRLQRLAFTINDSAAASRSARAFPLCDVGLASVQGLLALVARVLNSLPQRDKPTAWPIRRASVLERDCPTPIEADEVKRVLADIDTDRGDHTVMIPRHGVLLSLGASCQPTC